jgi:uncharacterized SAM-binding protein YcdF (DUF218 family)
MRMIRRLIAPLLILTIFMTSWTAYQWYDIFRIWRTATPTPADVAIVLGAAVWNGEPSPALRERLDIALELHQSGMVSHFICTGGIGDGPPSEASVCADYLRRHGVPASAIQLEERSVSTWQNLIYAHEIMEQEGFGSALIVTHGFHLKRALMQARAVGIVAGGAPVRIVPINLIYLTTREVAAITYFQLGGRERSPLTQQIRLDR